MGAITTTGMFSSISAIGPCFSSPAGITLRVDVGDFLELQRAFHCQRIAGAATEIEHVARPRARAPASRSAASMVSELRSISRGISDQA
jgi:hypothetical protein